MPYKQGFGPFAPEVYRAPYSDPFRGTGTLAQTIDVLETTVGAASMACVVVEPIAGEGGFVVPEPGWLAGLAAWCRANSVVFVADEIQSGFGRTGAWYALRARGCRPRHRHHCQEPGGGLPIVAITGRADLMDKVHPGGLGGTFGGNPLACAAALAAIETVESDGLLARARRIGEVMLKRLRAMAATNPVVGDARGRGAMVAMELVGPDGITPDKAATARVAAACHAQGLLVLSAGTYGNVLRLLPPLADPHDLLVEGLDILETALSAA